MGFADTTAISARPPSSHSTAARRLITWTLTRTSGYLLRKTATRRGRIYLPTVVLQAMGNSPIITPFSPDIVSSMCFTFRNASCASGRSTLPASLNTMLRPLRWKSSSPSCFSRLAICKLTAGWLR